MSMKNKKKATALSEQEETIRILKGYAKVLNQLAKEVPKYGYDKSFCQMLSGVGSKLLFMGTALPYKSKSSPHR
jgi:hypothetical protein